MEPRETGPREIEAPIPAARMGAALKESAPQGSTWKESTWIHARVAAIAAAMVAIIVYGSLYPFHFHRASFVDALQTLMASWNAPATRGDLIANFLLYIPFGFFAAQSLRRPPLFLQVVLVTGAGFVLTVSVELLQFFAATRVTNLSDVYMNTAGALAGAVAGVLLHPDLDRPLLGATAKRPFLALLLGCWLAYYWYPFVPVTNATQYWNDLASLFAPSSSAGLALPPTFPWLDAYRTFAGCLAVAAMLDAIFGEERSPGALAWLVSIAFLIKSLIAGSPIFPRDILAVIAGVAVWGAFLRRRHDRAAIVALIFGGYIVVQSLSPFQFSSVGRSFGLIPFGSFLGSYREAVLRAFFDKVFLYGALVWLMARAGIRWSRAATLGTLLVLVLRIAQIYLPGRTAEITDAVMLAMLACIMKLMGEARMLHSEKYSRAE